MLHELLDCVSLGASGGTTFPEIGLHRLAVTVAAGNGGSTAAVYPAADQADGALPVTSSTHYDELSSFSTYNRSWIDVAAPGEDIVSALPGGRYGVWSGTSMAAPIAAGVTALVRARYTSQCLTPHVYLEHLKETGIRYEWDPLPPWGRVRIQRVDALNAVTIAPACP